MSAPFIRCLPAWRQYSRPVVRLPGPSGPWTLGSLPGTHHTLRCSRGIVAALGDVAHIGERRPMVNVGDAMDPVLQIWVDEGNDDVVVRCEGTLNVATRGVLLRSSPRSCRSHGGACVVISQGSWRKWELDCSARHRRYICTRRLPTIRAREPASCPEERRAKER